MSSINLLPKTFDSKYKEASAKKIASSVSFLMVAISIVVYVCLYINSYNISKKIEVLNSNTSKVDKELNEEISNNELLSVEIRGESTKLILEKHVYFTKVVGVIQNNLIDEVYLNSLNVSYDDSKGLTFDFDGIAKNYSSVADQLSIFKNLPLIKDTQIKEISVNKTGLLDFGCSLEIEESILFYEDKRDVFN